MLEGLLNHKEVSVTNMKNDKSPGYDGFSSNVYEDVLEEIIFLFWEF